MEKNMKNLTGKIAMTVAVTVALVLNASADDKTATVPALNTLSSVTTAELPATAAKLVSQADVKGLKATTIEVVKTAVGLNPAAAPAIVASIAQASPDMAATASATAATLVPNQVVLIARAAAAAAPTKAGAIVEALCKVLPADYKLIADAVAAVVPGAGKEILTAVAAALPELKDQIAQALASYQGVAPSVSGVLNQVSQTVASSGGTPENPGSPNPRGPTVQPPIVTPSATPTVLTPGNGGVIPLGGGRGYSSP